jgi:hypothetical protein
MVNVINDSYDQASVNLDAGNTFWSPAPPTILSRW